MTNMTYYDSKYQFVLRAGVRILNNRTLNTLVNVTVNNGIPISGVCLDLQEAFDTSRHRTLFRGLHSVCMMCLKENVICHHKHSLIC